MLEEIKRSLERSFPKNLVDQFLETYSETKREFYLGHLRPNEVEGGRFAEAAFRLIEVQVKGPTNFTPLGTQIQNFERQCEDLKNLSQRSSPDSIRLHIPRTLRLIYDIRNKRDVAHLNDGIDPNVQDATFVVSCCDWVMAEFVRLFHRVTADEARRIVEGLVERRCPPVQDFGDFLKTLNPGWGPSERIIVLLYERAKTGATKDELSGWLKPEQRANLDRTLKSLEHDKDLVVLLKGKYYITARGILQAERRQLLAPPAV